MEETQTPVKERTRRSKSKGFLYVIIGVLVVALLSLAAVGYVFGTNEYHVDLTLLGEESITLEYGQTYEEPGAEAKGYGTLLKKEPREVQVELHGTVDTDKIGTYTVQYHAAFEDVTASAERTVTVVDTVAPEIKLTTDPEHFTFPGQPYEEEGFTAADNYDGDLTAQVTALEENGKVIYTVSDSSGNETKVEREIRYDDPVAPELTLKGEKKITITEGDKWKEPGYTASDNVDGDITDKVVVSGKVDHLEPGTYKLKYEVKDGYENAAKAERTVVVKAKPVPQPQTPPTTSTGTQSGSSNQSGNSQSGSNNQSGNTQSGGNTQTEKPSQNLGKVIYLTFDDGPSKHTARLLDILAKYNAKATFFVCNTGYLNLLDDIANDGHALALHSKTHEYSKIYASESAYFEDLYAIQDIVKKHSGVKSMLMRFPGGSSNGVSKQYCKGIMTRLTKAVEEKGFTYFDWNVDSKDAGGAKTANEVANNVINGIKKSSRKNLVVLQHDIKGFSVDAVEQILQWGIANGCTFKALTADGPVCHHGVNN